MTFAIYVILLGIVALRLRSWFALVCFVGAIAAFGATIRLYAGEPVPSWAATVRGSTLVAALPDEPHALYVWILPKGATVPLAITCPWNEAAAIQALSALANATQGRPTMTSCLPTKGNLGGRQTSNPGNGGGDSAFNPPPMFYNSPIRALPEKVK